MEKSDILNTLYEERLALLNRVSFINHLIIELGGTIIEENTIYSPNSTLTEKTLLVLKEIKEGTANEIADEIYKLEPYLDKEKLYKSITLIASSLNVKGEIESKREGKANRYYLK